MFTGRKDTSPPKDNKRPGSGYPPPSQSSAGRQSEPRKRKSGSSCNPVMWTSIMNLPWVTFILCGIIIAATIAWQHYFLQAARKTGQVLKLVQSQPDTYPYRLWRPYRKVVLGTAISIEVITLFVVIAAILRTMQSAVSAGRMRRGPPRNHNWSSIYLAITGCAATLMWFAVWWMVMLLGVSVAWQFGAVTTRNLARGALSQAQAYSRANAINLAAPNAPQLVQRKFNQILKPSLDAETQKKVQSFLDQNVLTASKVNLTVCPSTCMDAFPLRGALGSARCICDVKSLRLMSELAASVAKTVISVISCVICNAVAASLLVIDLVTRFIYARQEYEALGPRVKAQAKGSLPVFESEEEVFEEEEEEEDEEAGFAKGAPRAEEKVTSWQARPPSVASGNSSVPPGFQVPQARAPQAAAQQQAAQQRAQQQAAQQQAAQQQAAQQRQQQITQEMLMQLQARKQQQQHYSYAQQIQQQQQQRMMQQQQQQQAARRHPQRPDSVMGSDQQSVQSAWVMRR